MRRQRAPVLRAGGCLARDGRAGAVSWRCGGGARLLPSEQAHLLACLARRGQARIEGSCYAARMRPAGVCRRRACAPGSAALPKRQPPCPSAGNCPRRRQADACDTVARACGAHPACPAAQKAGVCHCAGCPQRGGRAPMPYGVCLRQGAARRVLHATQYSMVIDYKK